MEESSQSYLLASDVNFKSVTEDSKFKTKSTLAPLLSEERIHQIKNIVRKEVLNSKIKFGELPKPKNVEPKEKVNDLSEEIFCTNHRIKQIQKRMKVNQGPRANKFEDAFREQRKLNTFVGSKNIFLKIFHPESDIEMQKIILDERKKGVPEIKVDTPNQTKLKIEIKDQAESNG